MQCVCVCVCVVIVGCVVLVGNNGPHAFSIHSRPVGHRLRQEKSYDGAFLPLRAILSSFSYLSQFAVQYSFKIFIKVVQFPVLINSPVAWLWQGRIGGAWGHLISYYFAMDGLELGLIHIWAHITIQCIGLSWFREISKTTLLYDGSVGIGFDIYQNISKPCTRGDIWAVRSKNMQLLKSVLAHTETRRTTEKDFD